MRVRTVNLLSLCTVLLKRECVHASSGILLRGISCLSNKLLTLRIRKVAEELGCCVQSFLLWLPFNSGRHKLEKFCNAAISRLPESLVFCDPCSQSRNCHQMIALSIIVCHFMFKYSWPFFFFFFPESGRRLLE